MCALAVWLMVFIKSQKQVSVAFLWSGLSWYSLKSHFCSFLLASLCSCALTCALAWAAVWLMVFKAGCLSLALTWAAMWLMVLSKRWETNLKGRNP